MNLQKIIETEYESCTKKTEENISIENVTVPLLLKEYASYLRTCKANGPSTDLNGHERDYGLALFIVREINYSHEDITKFCLSFVNEIEETQKMGLFLSALVNTNYQKNKRNNTEKIEYKLITEHISNSKNISCIGAYTDGAKITIIGDIGDSLCMRMREGDILVQGNVKEHIGYQMRGGTIHITGNANLVGTAMIGGEIIVDGKIHSLAKGYRKMSGGTIYEKDRRVYP